MVKLLHRLGLPMMQEPEIKCWTAKHKVELIKQAYRDQATILEIARQYDQAQEL